MQGLYEWQMADNAPQDILARYREQQDFDKADSEYFTTLLLGVVEHREQIDQALMPLLSRPLKEVDPVELSLLRLAAYELMQRPDVPYRVVINEAVELCKTFGAEAGHKFVNGILDKLALQWRSAETARRSKPGS